MPNVARVQVSELAISGAYRLVPGKIEDVRGCFYELFRREELAEVTGQVFAPAQLNYSVSCRGALRGIHGTRVPPGQAKLVTCVRGAVTDVLLDLRVGSPSFGGFTVNRLDPDSGAALYVPDGIGHGFLALEDDTCMSYACSTQYVPGTQLGIHPLDPALVLPWQADGAFIMSEQDASAPTLAEAVRSGVLPTFEQCLSFYRQSAAGRPGAQATAVCPTRRERP